MITLETKNEIIRLRSLSYSYDSIASILAVSKPSVMKICKEHILEINVIQAEQISTTLQEATDNIEARSRLYRDLIRRLYDELANRDLTSVSTDRLMAMLEKAERGLSSIEMRSNSELTDFYNLSDNELAIIANGARKSLLKFA